LSPRLEDEPRELDRCLARPLVSEAVKDSEPVRDLNSELFSAKPEAIEREPVRDLNSELFSAKPEAIEREPVRDLNSELFSARLEAEVSEPVRALARPLV